MRLLPPQAAAAAQSCPSISAASFRPTLRPGERPHWSDAARWQARWRDWRGAANAAHVPVEVALVCLLEYDLALEDLSPWVKQPSACLRDAAERDREVPWLNCDPEMRMWLAVLDSGDHNGADGLPEIALPARLTARPTIKWRWGERIHTELLQEALCCERAASGLGVTLEGWALRAGLAALAGLVSG